MILGGIAANFYFFSIYLMIVIEFLFFIFIGFPVTLLILWLLNKYHSRVTLSLSQRFNIAIWANLLLSLSIGVYLYTDPYRNDFAFDHATETSNLSLPFYYATDIRFPPENNGADDFGVDRTLKFLYSPSHNDVERLEQLCLEDSRWKKVGGKYHYQESIFEEELVLEVEIDVEHNRVATSYLKW